MFKLGRKSKSNLKGVHPDLVELVEMAIQITDVDFAVHCGLRTIKEQERLVQIGASTTMNSRHLTGHAVDLVPYDNGQLRWDWPLCYKVARAMQTVALSQDTALVWGGVWDRKMNELSINMEDEVAEYVTRRKAAGKRAFIDGPHFQLDWQAYP